MLPSVSGTDQPGPGPALQPRSSADTEGDVQRILGKLESTGNDLRVVRYVANSSTAFRPFILLSDALMSKSRLPAAVREAVVLHLAIKKANAYEWHEHQRIGRAAGITDNQLDAIRNGRLDGDLFSEQQLLAVAIADEILAGAGLSRARWEAAIAAWGIEGAMDLMLSVGWWGGLVPLLLESLDLQPPPESS
jgi:alkylhydroperoxidase family enzyme